MIFATPSPTITAYATMAKVGWKPDDDLRQLGLGNADVHGHRRAVRGRGRGERLDQHVLPEGSGESRAGRTTPAMKLYMQIMAKYLPGKDTKNGLYFYGMAKAYDTVQELRTGREEPDAGVVHAHRPRTARSRGTRFAAPRAVKTTTGPKDHFPISQQRLIRFDRRAVDAVRPADRPAEVANARPGSGAGESRPRPLTCPWTSRPADEQELIRSSARQFVRARGRAVRAGVGPRRAAGPGDRRQARRGRLPGRVAARGPRRDGARHASRTAC